MFQSFLLNEPAVAMICSTPASNERRYPFGFRRSLVGVPPSPGLAAPRPVEHALRRGFSAPVGRFFPHLRAGHIKRAYRLGLQQRIVRDHHAGAVIQFWIGHPHNCAGDHQRGPSYHSLNIGNSQKLLIGRLHLRH